MFSDRLDRRSGKKRARKNYAAAIDRPASARDSPGRRDRLAPLAAWWRHYLEQRGAAAAEPEIRKLANRLLDVLAADSPHLFGDYTRTPLPDGTFEVTTPFPKV